MPDQNCKKEIRQTLIKLRQAIWARRTILGEIMTRHGDMNLHDYAMDFMDVNPSPRLDVRKKELIGTVHQLLSKRLDSKTADAVARQLEKKALVSSADHHAPIDHPFWVNANIISAIPYEEITDPDLKYLVVFSFASVSVNNSSGYPRGLMFHGGMNGTGNLIHLPFLPDKVKMGTVYNVRPYCAEDIARARNELAKKMRLGEITGARAKVIDDLITEHFADDRLLSSDELVAQITKINFDLWPRLFEATDWQPSNKLPGLIYLDIETIVSELLLRFHLDNADSLIHRLIFDKTFQNLSLTVFNNLGGAFSLDKSWGTYLFWAADNKGRHVQLALKNESLVGQDFSVPLNPEKIMKALVNKKIFPSMLLCYIIVALYYGIKCLGGFSQVHDLTTIKTAWLNLLMKVGENDEAEAVKPVQTRELGGDGMVLSYLKTPNGKLVPATGIDMILDKTDTGLGRYLRLARRLTMIEMMDPMLPEIYSVLYPSVERDDKLLAYLPEDILEATGLAQKLCL